MLRPLIALWLIYFQVSVSQANTLEIGTLDYPPYIHHNENKEVDGAATHILRAIFAEMDQPISIRIYPWARALSYLEEGKIDAVYTAYKTQQRQKFAIFSKEVLFNQEVSLFKRKGNAIPFQGDLKDISDISIITVSKVSYGSIFDKLKAQGQFTKLHSVPTAEQCLGMLVTGRTDLWINNRLGAMYIASKENKLDAIEEVRPAVQLVPSYIMFTKKKDLTQIRDQFDEKLRQFRADGRYNYILKSYLQKANLQPKDESPSSTTE